MIYLKILRLKVRLKMVERKRKRRREGRIRKRRKRAQSRRKVTVCLHQAQMKEVKKLLATRLLRIKMRIMKTSLVMMKTRSLKRISNSSRCDCRLYSSRAAC
jgi:hypothetical protein